MKSKALVLFLALLMLVMPVMQTLTEEGMVSAYAEDLNTDDLAPPHARAD